MCQITQKDMYKAWMIHGLKNWLILNRFYLIHYTHQ